MTRPISAIQGISRQRGFWLRCFLGRIFAIVLLVPIMNETVLANVCVNSTLHVRRVHGLVTDPTGRPISDARVTLRSGENTVSETTTDSTGAFRMEVPRGSYWLGIQARGFVHGDGFLRVGWGMKSVFHSDMLYMVLNVGAPDCPPEATTSKREFKRQIHTYENLLGERR